MRLVRISAKLMAAALLSCVAFRAAAQQPPAGANANKTPQKRTAPQAKPAPKAQAATKAQSAPGAVKGPQGAAAPKPAPSPAKAKEKEGKPAKQAAKPPANPAAPKPTAAEERKPVVRGRDPFQSLIALKTGSGEHLPPGKAGLIIGAIRLDGTVKAPSGMIAVVSNPEQRVYFIREGDQLYDGAVEKIALDEVVFRERSKDAFGKPVERLITKRLYATAGEQQ